MNAFLNKQIEIGIISEIRTKRTFLYNRTINTATKENFKNIFARKNSDYIKEIGNPNEP